MTELLATTPAWEIEAWKDMFAVFGPLDWKRDDLLFARVNQYQSVGGAALGEFLLFKDPTEIERKLTEEELMERLGYKAEPER